MDFDSLLKAYEGAKSGQGASRKSVGSNDDRRDQGPKRSRQESLPVLRQSPRVLSSPPRILVMVCAGPNSLHDGWFTADDISDGITLGVIWYGSEEPEERFTKLAEKVMRKKGPKWQLIRSALKELFPDWREYDYVWMPDDDIKLVRGRAVDLARLMAEYGLHLAQPCLTDKNITSIGYRSVVLRSSNPNSVYHQTNFVEIMCPMLSTQALGRVFPTFDTDKCQCGWGLDSVWPSMLEPYSVGVVDEVEVEHTRPPNAYNPLGALYSGIDPRREELDLLAKYRIAPFAKRTLAIIERK